MRTDQLRALVAATLLCGCGQAAINRRLEAIETSFDNELRMEDFRPATAVVNVPYSTRLSATGGAAPYEWRLVYGSLPAGLTLESTTGVIRGVPRVAGVSQFIVHLQAAPRDEDAVLTFRVHSVTLAVAEPAPPPAPTASEAETGGA